MAQARVTKAFGAVLRKRRQEAQLSQEELAHQAGTHQGYISMLERGERSPSLTTIQLLARALGTSMSEFIQEVEDALQSRRR